VGAENRLLRSYTAYPPPFVRFALMAALLRKLGVSPVESLRGLDPEGARTGPPVIVDGRDQRAQLGEDLDVVPRVADKLAGVALAHNLTLRELGRWQEGDFVPFGTTAGWTTAFGAADEPKPVETVESARLATSGAVWAWSSFLEQPATEDARTHLRDRVVRTIAKSREQDVRAATPPSGFAAADAGDRLCALVLTQAPEDGPGQP
jgi:hypothetical protein